MKINKLGIWMTIICTSILIIQFIFKTYFNSWTFNKSYFVIANRILGNFAFFGFFCFLLYTFKPKSALTILIGIISLLIFMLLVLFKINPIDTTTQPVDFAIIKRFPNETKLISRQYENAKTTQKIIDTVLVKDIFIFRKILKEPI
jgi:uncharacterized membrane protein YeiB